MSSNVRITVLSENTAGGRGLLAEHGLSIWIETDDRPILFDAGQGLVLSHNARELGIDFRTANDVVFSHGHYDHTGGLPELLEHMKGGRVYAHPAAFADKFLRAPDGSSRPVGAPLQDADAVRARVDDLVLVTGPTKVADGIWATGEIPRRTDFEDTGGPFYLDESCDVPDPLVDDQAVYFESGQGLVVLLGCAHAGLVNTLDYVAELTGCDRIHAVVGGMHLCHASEERIARSLEALERYGVRLIGAAHCTGLPAVSAMFGRWPERFVRLTTGSRLQFE